MTDVPVRAPVDPCPPEEPLVWNELPARWAAVRTLLAVLADTGAVVTLPNDGWRPDLTDLAITAGWTLQPDLTLDRETGRMLLSCEREPWPRPGDGAGGVEPTSGNK